MAKVKKIVREGLMGILTLILVAARWKTGVERAVKPETGSAGTSPFLCLLVITPEQLEEMEKTIHFLETSLQVADG